MPVNLKKMREILEFPAVLTQMAEYALCQVAKERIKALEPYLSQAEVTRHMAETSEARLILDTLGSPPLAMMQDLEQALTLTASGFMLQPEQLSTIALFITTCRRTRSYLRHAEEISQGVAYYGRSMSDLTHLEDEINRCIRGSTIDDHASAQLASLRRKIISTSESIKTKLDNLLRSHRKYFTDGYIAMRGDRFCLPLKREYKSSFPGVTVDISQSGGTIFIEPASVRKAHEELAELQIEEDNEVIRILYRLTALVEADLPSLQLNVEAMQTLDFIFAKAKYSQVLQAREVEVKDTRSITIIQGIHPLLPREKAVPLDFRIGDDFHGVIITGPNTGGKTVALKTVGLLSLMAQCGMHVPVNKGSQFAMHAQVLCDIGDGQSLSENLSTFSSHLLAIIDILAVADSDSLVLLDELGTGTDPTEGMGLAIALLEALDQSGCLLLATTHYPEVKLFADQTPGFCNARMTFDHVNLQPLYRLDIGTAGESCALAIATRLGLPAPLIQRANQLAYQSHRHTNTVVPVAP
ncbi:MAG: DNA mismatch repair protein MutS, partial [Symbiobacteriaceae bacterium]|nr:DNA mismatch repair protein MutS [Symbiobacteriaceae bacterium]